MEKIYAKGLTRKEYIKQWMQLREVGNMFEDIFEEKKLSIKDLRRLFRKELENKDLRIGYVANIAMLLHDRYGITDYETRNRAAEDILILIFN